MAAKFLDIALALARMGFRVFPLIRGKKQPLPLVSGDHFDAATTDEAQIILWDKQKSDANVGIAPDENFCFLETDDEAALKEACADLPAEIWETMRVSARDNRCYYVFRQTMRTRKAGNMTKERPGEENLFEFKQCRMLVTGPGSTHPTGAIYKAETRSIPAMPDVLLNRLCELDGAPAATATGSMNEDTKRETELLDRFLAYYEVPTTGNWFNKARQWYRPIECPWAASHENPNEGTSTCVVFTEGGGYGFDCKHKCSEKDWKTFRAELEARFPDKPRFAFLEAGPEVHVGKPAPEWNPRLEIEHVDYIDQLAEEVTDGTALPFSFARETFKLLLLAGLHEPPVLPWFKTLHTRQYLILLSDEPGVGKGETWRRSTASLEKAKFLEPFDYELVDGGNLGSPEFAVVRFGGKMEKRGKETTEPKLSTQITKPRHIVWYDEGKQLQQKDAAAGSSGLVTMFTKLFDGNRHSTGSFKNGFAEVTQANVSLVVHFVREAFELTFAGSGVTSDGFLSRCTFVFDKRNQLTGDWRIVDSVRVAGLMEKARACMERRTLVIDPDTAGPRLAFANEIRGWEPKFRSRLEFLFNQDMLARAVFSVEGRLDRGAVERAIKWTRHQYATRTVTYPLDVSPDKREQMSVLLQNAFEKHGDLTRAQLERYAHVRRIGSGGFTIFKQVLLAMNLEVVGKTRKGTPVYRLRGE
jgi:Bifunctional DNA primase/polymerase, N-terminal